MFSSSGGTFPSVQVDGRAERRGASGRRWRARALAWLGVVAAATLGACTFFLEGVPGVGSACTFDGADSLCGTCVESACQDAIDSCCGDDCGGTLPLLDRCAGSDDLQACADIAAQRDGAAACIVAECADSCPVAERATYCSGELGSCTCDYESDPDSSNATPCTGDLCCGDAGWPATGLSCLCESVGCIVDEYGCSCGFGLGDSNTGSCNDFFRCCATSTGCECDDLDLVCDLYVEDCSAFAFICGGDRVEVPACDVAAP